MQCEPHWCHRERHNAINSSGGAQLVQHYMQASFSMFWRSSGPIIGTRNSGIEALSNVAPHLEQLHTLAL